MTPLRKKMEADLGLRNLALRTQAIYVGCVSRFARHYGRSPAELGTDEVRAFLQHLAEIGRAPSTRKVYHAALRFLYAETLGRPDIMETVPRPRVKAQPRRRPLTREEINELLAVAATAPFTYTMVSTLLATGLRLSEACSLQVRDIDSRSGLIHVRHGKGGTRRSVQLGTRHLRLLRRYWQVERPRLPWLFPAQRLMRPGCVDPRQRWADHPVAPSTVRIRLRRLATLAGLQRHVTPHDLRCTYGTWLIEAGVNLRIVQMLLGHKSPMTTTRYTQVRPDLIRRTVSPLDML